MPASASTTASCDSRSLDAAEDAGAEQVEGIGHLAGGAADVGQLRLQASDAVDLAGEVLQGARDRLGVDLDLRVAYSSG